MTNPELVAPCDYETAHKAFEAALLACMDYMGARLREVEAERDRALQERDRLRRELQALTAATGDHARHEVRGTS